MSEANAAKHLRFFLRQHPQSHCTANPSQCNAIPVHQKGENRPNPTLHEFPVWHPVQIEHEDNLKIPIEFYRVYQSVSECDLQRS